MDLIYLSFSRIFQLFFLSRFIKVHCFSKFLKDMYILICNISSLYLMLLVKIFCFFIEQFILIDILIRSSNRVFLLIIYASLAYIFFIIIIFFIKKFPISLKYPILLLHQDVFYQKIFFN